MSYPARITLSEYITARWKQLGVKHIFGCPGDFNLEVRLSSSFLSWLMLTGFSFLIISRTIHS